MKLIFDDGTEQDIKESDFIGILQRAKQKCEDMHETFKIISKNPDTKTALIATGWAIEESDLKRCIEALLDLYFR